MRECGDGRTMTIARRSVVDGCKVARPLTGIEDRWTLTRHSGKETLVWGGQLTIRQ